MAIFNKKQKDATTNNGISSTGRYHYYRKKFTPYGFIGPAMFMMGLVLLFPLLFLLKVSFQEWHFIKQPEPIWLGLQNYLTIFQSSEFWNAMGLQVLFVVICVGLELVIGMGVALLFNRDFPGGKLARALLLLPIFVLPVISGLTFRFMYNPQYGAINFFIKKLGMTPIAWLSQPNTAFLAIIIQDVWRMWPFMFMILFAGLAALPKEPYEAALLDGASRGQLFTRITLPLMRPTILIAIVLRTVDALKAFPEIYVMTNGGPGTSTTLLSVHIYKYAFDFWNLGYSAAASYVLVFVALIFSTILVKNTFED